MEQKANNYYHVKYQRKLIEKVLLTEFHSIKDLSDFINSQEEAKMKSKSKDYVI